jgi:hypothetical protein
MTAGRADAERERLPPVLEARMLDRHGQRSVLDVAQPGLGEQLCEMPLARARKLRLVGDVRVELAGSLPERMERSLLAGVIPDAGRDDAAGSRHPGHLAQSPDRVCQQMDDELSEGAVELRVLEGKLLCRSALHGHSRMPLSSRCQEWLGRIRGGDAGRAEPMHELGGQGTRAGAHVDHSLPGDDSREVRERRGEWDGVPPHEPVVGLSGDVEGQG